MDLIEFFLRMPRKLIILAVLYPVFFGKCARGGIKASPFCLVFSLESYENGIIL